MLDVGYLIPPVNHNAARDKQSLKIRHKIVSESVHKKGRSLVNLMPIISHFTKLYCFVSTYITTLLVLI
jgi:hypothetical protein